MEETIPDEIGNLFLVAVTVNQGSAVSPCCPPTIAHCSPVFGLKLGDSSIFIYVWLLLSIAHLDKQS